MSLMTQDDKRKPGRPPKFPKPDQAPRSKRTFNITLSPETAEALAEFIAAQEFTPERSDVVERALIMFLREKGYPKKKPKDTT